MVKAKLGPWHSCTKIWYYPGSDIMWRHRWQDMHTYVDIYAPNLSTTNSCTCMVLPHLLRCAIHLGGPPCRQTSLAKNKIQSNHPLSNLCLCSQFQPSTIFLPHCLWSIKWWNTQMFLGEVCLVHVEYLWPRFIVAYWAFINTWWCGPPICKIIRRFVCLGWTLNILTLVNSRS